MRRPPRETKPVLPDARVLIEQTQTLLLDLNQVVDELAAVLKATSEHDDE